MLSFRDLPRFKEVIGLEIRPPAEFDLSTHDYLLAVDLIVDRFMFLKLRAFARHRKCTQVAEFQLQQ